MKKLKLFIFTLFMSGLILGINAQDTIRGLIISEHRSESPYETYVELANVGTDTIDLGNVGLGQVVGKVFLVDSTPWRIDPTSPLAANLQLRLSGTLLPGETWMMMGISDMFEPGYSVPQHKVDLLPLADTFCMTSNIFGYTDTIIPEYQMWTDSTSRYAGMFWTWGNKAFVIWCYLANGDSVLIDSWKLDLSDNNAAQNSYVTINGIEEASRYYTCVRKAWVTEGSLDWTKQNGTTQADGEWIVIPNEKGFMSFTTVKNHGDYHIDVTSSIVDVDLANGKLTVPWGIYKGDSIITRVTLGPNMAWQYIEDDDIADSTHAIMQDGDTVVFYAAGNELEVQYFEIDILDPEQNEARVFPLRYKKSGGYYWSNPSTNQWEWNPDDAWITPYYVAGDPSIDTIGNVPYATRVDTLYRYLEKAPNANWEIVWHDATERADLQNGDILKVTAEDGTTTHEYYIDVQDYAPSDVALLSAITWPDKEEFMEGWKGDTIPGFDPMKTTYVLTIPYTETNVPALTAHKHVINAKVEVDRAVSLAGSQADRTTTFTVTAESDTTVMIYSVIFQLEKEPSKIQKYYGTPFFSESATNQRSWASYLEIVNPTNVSMDLSEYIIVRSADVVPGTAIEHMLPDSIYDVTFKERYNCYVPGYKFEDDTTAWINNPGILSLDADVYPEVEPGGVFVMAVSRSDRYTWYPEGVTLNKRWDDAFDTLDINELIVPPMLRRGAEALYMFKIVGDSVLAGTKPVGDPADYELVDVIGDPVIDDDGWSVAGQTIGNVYRGTMFPKPYIYTGARSLIECVERFGTAPDTSDWITLTYGQELPSQDNIRDLIGSHVMDPVTVHISTVTSSVYLASDGYATVQTIQGDLASTTVEAFYGNIDKADPGQYLSMISGTDGSMMDPTDPVAENDTLLVASADSLNFTKYALVNIPLDTDAVLTLVDDPSDYTITINGSTGTVEGMAYGALLKDVIAAVKVPNLAVMNVINGAGELLPMQILNYDTVKVDVIVGDDVYFEVIAQDGVTIITYKLEVEVLSSDAFVVSSVYEVDQENVEISGLAEGTSVELFKSNIEVVTGATATVLSKLGHERSDGIMYSDDVLQVVSQDGTNTVTYFLTFLNEENPDANLAPEVVLAFSDTNMVDIGTIMLKATATDDGLPPPPALTYMWEVTEGTPANVVIEDADSLETNVTINVIGVYVLTLSVSDGSLTTQAAVEVNAGALNVGQIQEPAMRVYPNPATEKLTLELVNMPGRSTIIYMYNITGSMVYNRKLEVDKIEIDINGFDAGLYFIRVVSEDHTFTHSVEIQ